MVDLQDDSINLRALRKIDDNIKEILFSAGQVAIYYFNIDSEQWKRKEIEGALFFVKRNTQSEYAFVVINKLSTMNLVQRITKDFETNLQLPYLMYKNTENEIYCVWFYDKDNCITLNQKIAEIIEKMKKNPPLSHSINNLNGLNSTSNSTNSDLLKMILSVENNAPEIENQALQVLPPAELPIKPIAQRRSFNLKDLFESHLTISNIGDSSTSIKAEENNVHNKPEIETPYQFIREGKMKNNPPSKMSANSFPNNNEDIDSKPVKPAFDNFLQQNSAKLPQNSLFETKKSDSENSLYLTMEQLKKTMIYLLQNDADFLHSIHTAYVTAIKK